MGRASRATRPYLTWGRQSTPPLLGLQSSPANATVVGRDALAAVAGVRAAVDELAGLLLGHLRYWTQRRAVWQTGEMMEQRRWPAEFARRNGLT